jgi:hypothetical protein
MNVFRRDKYGENYPDRKNVRLTIEQVFEVVVERHE